MKTIQLYSPYWSTLGGGEKYVLALAEALSLLPRVQVTLLSTDTSVTKENLERFFNLRLGKTKFTLLPQGIESLRSATEGVDLFVCISNFQFYESSARANVFLLQVPYAPISSLSVLAKAFSLNLKEAAKDISRRAMFPKIGKQVDLTLVNSQFVYDVLLRNFGVRSSILYPPIQDFAMRNVRRRNIILSVGRFFRGLYNDKRYDVLTRTFRSLSSSQLSGWEYHIVGSCTNDTASLAFVEELRRENEGFPVVFHVNESHAVLRRLYNEAKVLWHAAGFGESEKRHPERLEHFGMTTVEAMSAGCIPVVINKGGQREIIQHGISGFLWNTTDELAAYTTEIAQGTIRLTKTRRMARARFKRFSIQRFRREAARLFAPLLARG